MSIERSKPAFPTYGPEDGSGRDWHQYFTDLRRSSRPVDDPDDTAEPESEPEVVITVPAHEVESGWPGVITTWRNRLLANDWQVKVGSATSQNPDTYWQNGNLRKAAHEGQMWWINAAKPGRYITISYYYEAGKNVRTSRTIRGILRLLSDAEMRDAVEADD